MIRLLSISIALVFLRCAPPPAPSGSGVSTESSRNAGGTTPAPQPTGAVQAGLFGAVAADAATRDIVHKCLVQNRVIARQAQYTCLAVGAPQLNLKLRRFSDLRDPVKFPANIMSQISAWMAQKTFKEEHFDFAATCKSETPDNSICKDASGNKVIGTIFSFAKTEAAGSTIVSPLIITGQTFE